MLVFRVGSNIPVPGINRDLLDVQGQTVSRLVLIYFPEEHSKVDFTISCFEYLYVIVSINVQLTQVFLLRDFLEEGNEGRKWRQLRYLTVVLGLDSGNGLTIGL